jgi:hypothetical protein
MMVLLYAVLGAIARLWFGADDLPKLLQNRGLQTAYMLVLFASIYLPGVTDWLSLCVALFTICWLQFQYWSRGHGICIDTGDSTNVSEKDIERYNDRWYAKVCDKLLPNRKYGFLYDNIYLALRYTAPMIIAAIVNLQPGLILIGLSIPFIYTFSNELQEREPWVFDNNKWYWRRGWSLAEMLSGAVTYGGCYFLTKIS